MGKMMKAAVFEKVEKITVKQVPVPEISEDEVLIKVKYTGICGTDWSIYTGKYSADKLPLIAGHEFSGTIAQVGKKARNLREGDRVTADINMSCGSCFYCRQGQKLLCPDFHQLGIHVDGTYAEYVKAPWEQVHKLPENLTFLQAAFIRAGLLRHPFIQGGQGHARKLRGGDRQRPRSAPRPPGAPPRGGAGDRDRGQ